jgi:hypothetical protein
MNKFREFREREQFVDCILKCGKKSVKCHRIVLSRFSNTFREIFTKTPQKKTQEIDIPHEFEQNIEKIINFLYGTNLGLTEDNIVVVLAFALRYEINILETAARDLLASTYAKKETVLNISRQMISLGIADHSEQLIQYFVENFDYYNLNELIRSVSAKELGMILGDDNFKTNVVPLEQLVDFKLSLLDKFYELSPIYDEKTKEFLEALFDFEQEDSYLFVVKHKCKWARDKTVRPLYRKAIKLRKEAYNKFAEDAQNIEEGAAVSRWVPIQWCSEILNAVKSFGEFETINFCMTLGGTIKEFNPLSLGVLSSKFSIPLGLRDVDTIEKMYNAVYGPQGAFMNNNQYFTSVNAGANISVSFGPKAVVKINKIVVGSIPKEAGKVKLNKKPESVTVNERMRLGYPSSLRLTSDRGVISEDVEYNENAMLENLNCNANEVTVSMPRVNEAGGNILRVGCVRIYGRFASSE